MAWKIKKAIARMPHLNNPVLVEGLPGIGNIGKIAVDFMIEDLKAEKLCEFASYSLPNTVFVDENSLIELPIIELYYKKFNNKNKKDILLLSGDIQPIEEESSYEFSYTLLDLMKELKSRELITIGGIGLQNVPEKPKVYCTGTSKKYIDRFAKDIKVNKNLFGVVGPIMGITGLLVGLAREKNIDGACLLAETLGHPLYAGVKGSEEVLKILQTKLGVKLNIKALRKEMKEVETEILKRTEQLAAIAKKERKSSVSYIG